MYGNSSLLLASLEATDGGTRYLIFGAIMMPAVVMAITKSTWLVEYYFLVVCTNRLIRRIVDWYGGEYDFRPISSLTPLLIAVLMLSVVVLNYHSLSKENRRFGSIILSIFVVSAIIGVRNGIAMIYGLLECIAPIALLGYAISLRADSALLVRWLRSISVMGCAIAAYAWFQWVELPPWDAFWVEQSGMWTSMGRAENIHIAVPGTLESRGPFAWFMATLAIPLILNRMARSYVNWLGLTLIVSSILPTTVRSAFGMILLATIGYVLARGVTRGLHLFLVLGMVMAVMIGIRRTLPESEYLFERLETVTRLTEDGSFQGRMAIGRAGFGSIISNPFGFGLGSSGLSTHLSGGKSIILDNGYLELLATLGVLGVGIIFLIILYVARNVYNYARIYDDDDSYLTLSLFISSLGALLFANWVFMPCSGIAMICLAKVVVDVEQASNELVDADEGFAESDDYLLIQEDAWTD